MKIKLGVIFGGNSVEHEVSIISAVQAMKSMNEEKYEIIPIYITKEKEWYTGPSLREIETYKDINELKRTNTKVSLINDNNKYYLQSFGMFKKYKEELDVAFPIVHGTNVEDGILQGYLETIGIPYVGSDVYASVVGQDKVLQKLVYKSFDLPLTDFYWFYDVDYLENKDKVINNCKKIKFPLVVKPATLGSSVGISFAKNEEELVSSIDEAIKYDKKILVEKAVENLVEVNISVLGNYKTQELSLIEEVTTKNDVLTFEDKYISGGKKSGPSKGMLSLGRRIPAQISEKLQNNVEGIAKKAFKALGSSGVARIDFMIDEKEQKVYINEINSCPGSLAFYLWEPKGKKYTELLDDMVKIAIRDSKDKQTKVHSFKSNILEGYKPGAKTGKKL